MKNTFHASLVLASLAVIGAATTTLTTSPTPSIITAVLAALIGYITSGRIED